MRISSYNRFFAEVAKIMSTSVKAVKQLDGRYKVELANNVYLDVGRGVGGSLSVHDHRGIERIASCYDFEDFKTIKDLYERLVSDYSESAEKEVMEVKKEYPHHTSWFWSFPTVEEMRNNICFCCLADRQGNRCRGKEFCSETWTRYKAIVNPKWHHVSLATLANIDFDMLDEKRKLVCSINQILKDGICNLYKCENHISFEVLERYVIRKCDELIQQNRLKAFWFSYIARQLDEVRRNTTYLYTPYSTAHRNR